VTTFDFAVIGIIILSGIFAYSRGFVREALSIAAWINASFAAYWSFPYARPLFERLLPRGIIADVATAAVVFIIALVVLHMISNRLAERVKDSSLSPIDRTFGLIFGLARGLVIVCIGYIALAWVMPPEHRPRWFSDARSLPLLESTAAKFRGYVPLPSRGRSVSTTTARQDDASEREADRAIGAFSAPQRATQSQATAPNYTPEQQRDLNRLIQQQNGQ
jgi:membrane protein required for colicin V production